MEELIKQIFLLNEKERFQLYKILEQSFNFSGEDFMINIKDIDENILVEINDRLNNIKEEKNCLIEFDDHILSLKL